MFSHVVATGIPDPGTFVTLLTPIANFFSISFGVASIGLLFSISFLHLETNGFLRKSAINNLKWISTFAILWALSEMLVILLTLSNLLAQPITASLDLTSIRSYLWQTSLGKVQLTQVVIAVVIAIVIPIIRNIRGSITLFLLGMAGIITPIFQSHGSESGLHGLAIGSLIFHVIGITLWVGGLVSLFFIAPEIRNIALPRFSGVALWAAIIVSVSGVANAWTRLNFISAWSSKYAYIVIAKAVLTAILIGIGYKHRKFIINNLSGTPAMIRLIFNELFIMFVAIALGTWLSISAPPLVNEVELDVDRVLSITGVRAPAAPTLSNLLLGYEADGFILGALLVVTFLYIRGVILLSKQGVKWPIGRTISFALGIAAIDYATSGGLGLYSHFAFSFHMIAHMILGMIAPIGIILGAPITLALRVFPAGRDENERGIKGLLVAVLHSKPVAVLTHPIVALALFDGSLFIMYFTSLFGNLMTGHFGHLFMNIHFILVGMLFFHVIVGIDPNPRKVPHLVRIIVLFAAMSIHAFFSIALMSSTSLLDGGYFASLQRPWFVDLFADQKLGGSIGWAMGEIPIVIALIATFIQWVRDDAREAKRFDRNADRLVSAGKPDELAEYNNYLAKLAENDRRKN